MEKMNKNVQDSADGYSSVISAMLDEQQIQLTVSNISKSSFIDEMRRANNGLGVF